MRGSRSDARRRRHVRVRKRLRGSGDQPRLGRTIAAASSREGSLHKKTLSVETAGEVGKLIAARAADAGVKTVVFDRGGFAYHGRIKALAEAAREGGLKF